jgi:hypothetical protein
MLIYEKKWRSIEIISNPRKKQQPRKEVIQSERKLLMQNYERISNWRLSWYNDQSSDITTYRMI